jgi:Protein of unknown function (DUF3102)
MRSSLAGDGEWEGGVMTKLSLEQLTKNAQLINAAHKVVVSANKTSIEKAIEAGEMLKACKDSVSHGEWSKWLYDTCRDISDETARLYMRLADPKNAQKLEEAAKQNGNAVADLSVRGAAQVIRAKPTAEQEAAREATKKANEQAKAADDAARAAALIPKQLRGMSVDNVVSLLKATFDLDYLDTLSEALQKHLKDDTERAQGPVAGIVGVRRVLTPQAKPV